MMKKTAKEIIDQIKVLLDELEGVQKNTASNSVIKNEKTTKKVAGCIGALQNLIDENFFEHPKTVSEATDKLTEEGQPYSNELVSMNLLNLVKPPKRILRRFKENNKWQYILRK